MRLSLSQLQCITEEGFEQPPPSGFNLSEGKLMTV